ncbi:MAG: hypothetical protein HFE95_04760 [Acutalibacter sp.]|nr:hypothetical protein [Acutalibacter sp.]
MVDICPQGWLQSSADYNRYFMEHDHIDSVSYARLDMVGMDVNQAARAVHAWLRGKMEFYAGQGDIL